jgi:hypothetical protein
MRRIRGARLATALAVSVALAQQHGRFAALKSQAFDLFQKAQYLQVAATLEEVWEQDQSDPKVAEYLAMGYLYGEKNLKKASDVMAQALARGGQATFLVHHSHEHAVLLSGDVINNYCTGRISISHSGIAFIADSTDHSVTFGPGELKDFRVLGGGPGRIQIKGNGRTDTFRVKSQTREEAILLAETAKSNYKP